MNHARDLLVRVRGLAVDAGPVRVLHEVDLELHAGRCLALVGPSGAGKTTLARCLADALPSGLAVSGDVDAGGARVGFLPQDAPATLNPARRIGTALGELVRLHGTPPPGRAARRRWQREEVWTLLRRAGLGTLRDAPGDALRRFPTELSGGQRTRVALAQVLSVRPDVLVLDEPTTGLDPVTAQEVVRTVRGLVDDGAAVVVVTHDSAVVDGLADDVRRLRGGRLDAGRPRSSHPARAPQLDRPPSAGQGTAVLSLDTVTVRARGHTLLDAAHLTLTAGESVGVVGRSGAGKTTLARVAAGLLPANGGEVRLLGQRVSTLGRRSRQQIASCQYVWQETHDSFEPHLPLCRQVARTAVRLRGLSWAEAEAEATTELEALGLTAEETGRLPHQVSGGQLRRAGLARAVLARPRVLLCDEVTTGLDPASASVVLDRVDHHRTRHGTAVILIGHDLTELARRTDRMVGLDAGRVVDARDVVARAEARSG